MKVIIRALSAQAEKEREKRENKQRFARRVDCIRAFITPKTREQLERMKLEHDQLFDHREDCRQAFIKRLKDKAAVVGAIPLVRFYHALNLLRAECRKRIKEQRKYAALTEITASSINQPLPCTSLAANQNAAQSDTGSERGYQFCEENEMGKRKNKHRHQNKTRQAVIIPERVKVVDRNVQATPVKAPHDAVNDFLSWCDDQRQEEEPAPDCGEYQDYANVISAEEQQQAAEAAAEAAAAPEPPPVQTREEAIVFFYQRQKLFQEQTRKEDKEAEQRRKDAQAAAEAAKLQELAVPENPQPVPRPEPVKPKMSEQYRRAILIGLKKNHPDIYARAIADPDMTPEEAWKLAGIDMNKPAEYKPRQADPKAIAEAEAFGLDRGYTPGRRSTPAPPPMAATTQQQRGPWNFKQEPQQRNNSFFKDEIKF